MPDLVNKYWVSVGPARVIAFDRPWSYSRLWTISAHSPTPPSSATQDSCRKLKIQLHQKSIGKRKGPMDMKITWTHTSDTSLSTGKQIRPSYILQVQRDDLYPDLHRASQAQKVKGTCPQRLPTIARIRIEGHKKVCLRPRRINCKVRVINWWSNEVTINPLTKKMSSQ